MEDEGCWKDGGGGGGQDEASPPVQKMGGWGRRHRQVVGIVREGVTEKDRLMFDVRRWRAKTARFA